MKEFLIVGMGFSGIAMAWELEKRNISYVVADPLVYNSATAISGGLVNPVTGRKYNLQWNIRELTTKLIENCSSLEHKLSVQLLFDREILKIHKSESALEEWQSNKSGVDLKDYINTEFIPGSIAKFLDFRFGSLLIRRAYQINTIALVKHFSEYLKSADKLIQQSIEVNDIKVEKEYFSFQHDQFRHLIFCDGIHAMQNPYFNFIQFKPAKGESLIIEIPHFETSLVIQKGVTIIPLGANKYWAGATNAWEDLTNKPTDAGRTELEIQLKDMLKVPFNVLQHHAAIRPTIRDRVPVLGEHPSINRMYTLNGMGTKGASLSWYYAEQLIEEILFQKGIAKEANVTRFF